MDPLQPEALNTLINAMPQAALVINSSRRIVCSNSAAGELLGETSTDTNADLLFDEPKRFVDLINRASRSSGVTPAMLSCRAQDDGVRINVRLLTGRSVPGDRQYLLTFEPRERANTNMLLLKQRLSEVDRQNHKLLAENRSMARTINHTLPRLKALSYEDALTGAYNRRFFDQQYLREWHRALRRSSDMTLVCIDIDHFKLYNDNAGHVAGDECLKAVAEALLATVTREFDYVCRTGGEEFVLLLPMTKSRGGIKIAQQALEGVRGLNLPHPTGGIVTVSAGVGTCQPHIYGDHLAFHADVDKALYRAKESGRDCLVALSRSDASGKNPGPMSCDRDQPSL